MASRLDDLYDRLGSRIEPLGIARAIDDKRVYAQMSVGIVLIASLNWAILVVVQLAFSEWATGAIDIVLLLIGLVSGAVFLRTGKALTYTRITIWASAASVLAIHILLGGYAWSGNYLLWGISNAVLAALWLSKRATVLITAMYLIAAVVMAFLEPTLQSWRGDRPDPAMATINTVQILVTTAVLIAPVVILMRERIFEERSRSRDLMLNILPESIADRLQANPGLIADDHENCTVVFADLAGFSEHSRVIPAQRLVHELNTIFVAFDHIVTAAGGEKIKTMGDGYMAAFGVPEPRQDHVERACESALEMVELMDSLNQELSTEFRLRVGVATGHAVAGVIGESKFSYDLWSDTVTLASRLEGVAEPNSVAVNQAVVDSLNGSIRSLPMGEFDLKGAGKTKAYRLVP